MTGAAVPTAPVSRRTLPVRVAVYLLGTVLVGIGVAAMVRSRLGVAPNDVLNTGVASTVGIGVGTASWLVGIGLMTIAWTLGRPPLPATIVGGIIVGLMVNAVLGVLGEPTALPARVTMFTVGICAVWAGIVAVVSADIGAGPAELVMLALVDRGLGMRGVRWGIEVSLLVAGVVLGGDANVGTAVFALGTGPVLAVALPPACTLMGTTFTTYAADDGPPLAG